MIQLIKDLSIYSLLGLQESDITQKNELVDAMGENIIGLVMERFAEAHPYDDMDSLMNSLDLEEQVLKDTYPDIQEFINQEVYVYKKGALLDAVNGEINFINSSPDENSEETLSILNNLKGMLEDESTIKNDEEFEMAWMSFIEYLNN